MSSLGTVLLDYLRKIERRGDFCFGSLRDILMPTIDVDGTGRIAFPLLPVQGEQLVANADPAPYGRGEETVVDRDVRRTWQIDSSKVHIGGRNWEKTLTELVTAAARGLGVSDPVVAELYKLLIYDTGSFFVEHRDTEKVPGMFATMVLVLPSIHQGGELIIKHLGREVVLDLRPEEPSQIGLAAFYADCVHEVRPLASGFRLTLVYSLRFLDKRPRLDAPDYRAIEAQAADVLRGWAAAEDEPDKLILPLEHAYTPAELSFDTLKGADAGMASVLVKAAAAADCDLHLALVSVEESGIAEHSGGYGRGRWSRDEDDKQFEVVEVCERELILSHWRRPDGSEPNFHDFPFDETELCPPDAFEDLTPDEQHFHEASGNEGASFERTYRRAGLVVWPRLRRLVVLNQAGLGATLPHVEALTHRWEANERTAESPLWREADELAGHMLSTWPRGAWRQTESSDVSRMLGALVKLGNARRIDAFLAEISAEGHYAASDNETIVCAAALLSPARAGELLVRIIRRNAATDLGACGDLLRRCVTVPELADHLTQIGAALVDILPGWPQRPVPGDWGRPATLKPAFVIDLLSATSSIDAALAARAVEQLLARPEVYQPDSVLVPAALDLVEQPKHAAWPAVQRLREACLDHLRNRIALPLEAPRTWTRTNPLTCNCADCSELGVFLIDPDRKEWRLKAAQGRRSHVEQNVLNTPCDVEFRTERRGSPHVLVAIKNQASYERRATQRRQDLQQVAALGG